MSMPVRVEPRLTDEHTSSVVVSACGIERMSSSSAGVIAFETSAEKPPMKFTPTSCAARSSVCASRT